MFYAIPGNVKSVAVVYVTIDRFTKNIHKNIM